MKKGQYPFKGQMQAPSGWLQLQIVSRKIFRLNRSLSPFSSLLIESSSSFLNLRRLFEE